VAVKIVANNPAGEISKRREMKTKMMAIPLVKQ
jgi:hypothetical protein